MKPIEFPEQNHTFVAGPTCPDALDLPCFVEPGHIISKWQLTDEEVAFVKEKGYIWLAIHSEVQPPINLIADDSIFTPPENPENSEEATYAM